MPLVDQERRSGPRRLDDIAEQLASLPDDGIPPLRLLFRLSELGIKDPASVPVPELRLRVKAISELNADRAGPDRRTARRRRSDRTLTGDH